MAQSSDAHACGAFGVIAGKLYVAGGADDSADTSTTEVYEPATNAWTTLAPLPTAVEYLGSAVACGKLYVIGGNASGTIVNTVQVYDPSRNTWITFTPLPSATESLGAATVHFRLLRFRGNNHRF